jgi:hypothetical protein
MCDDGEVNFGEIGEKVEWPMLVVCYALLEAVERARLGCQTATSLLSCRRVVSSTSRRGCKSRCALGVHMTRPDLAGTDKVNDTTQP